MSVSGTYSFSVTANDICLAALRGLHVYGPTDTVPATDITYMMQALNIVVKSLAAKGVMVWTMQDLAVPTVANQATYYIGPTGPDLITPSRPMRILDAYMKNPTNNDVQIKIVSRFDYDLLGIKNQTGVPNQMIYDPQFPNGIVTLYNVPADNTYTLHIIAQRQLMDFNATTDNPDFPQESYQMLKWLLMDEVALEYEASALTIKIVAAKALQYQKENTDFEQEEVSMTFSPSSRIGQGA